MTKLTIALGLVAVLVAGFAFWVRLAPTDPSAWHQPAYPKGLGDFPADGGFEAVRPLNRPAAEVLAEADRVIMATPRTDRIAGSVEEGMITYVTRSALWGFPDYTTVWVTESETPTISFHGRLRFGRSDMGVNRARIEDWLAELDLSGA